MRAARSACNCTRSPLVQPARPFSVPDFLAPALLRPAPAPRSSPATRRRLRTEAHPRPQHPFHLLESPPPPKWPLKSRLPLPKASKQHDIGAWVAALDILFPAHLRQDASREVHEAHSVPTLDIAQTLNEAHKAGHDILTYICLVEGRWEAASWIVKKLVEDGARMSDPPLQLEPSANVIWPESDSLHDLTNKKVVTHRVRPSRKLVHSLDDLTSAPDSIHLEHAMVKKALGHVWLSLGTMILKAAEDSGAGESSILSHVLEIIAYLHHTGLIPESVYASRPAQHHYALQQPPTLHMLSSNILTALSDAGWRAHEASAKLATERRNANYLFGHEIPGSRFTVQVQGIAPELWLELVLWSCLHGGWISDGATILERIVSQRGENTWNVISWKQLTREDEEESRPSNSWGLFGKWKEAKAEARTLTRRTISSEVVTAFVDGLVNLMRLGVGARGTDPEDIVSHIKKLKQLLDRNAHSLGSASWDSIMIRLLESGGVLPVRRPDLLLSIAGLASVYGSEVASINACSQASESSTEPPYFYEPTTTSISLLHWTMWSYVQNGDLSGAMAALNTLQQYTDHNKQKSMQQFFEELKKVAKTRPRQDEPFTSRIHSIDFPAFDLQLPIPLLAKLLDLTTEAKAFDLGHWLLRREELDGPLITRDMYSHPSIAASIIRFGTLAGENDLVMEVVKETGIYNSKEQTQRLPDSLLTTLMESQIQLHRWEAVASMQEYILNSPRYRPESGLLATFASELLRLPSKGKKTEPQKKEACDAFVSLLFAWDKLILSRMSNAFYCILAIMSSVYGEWREFCVQFLTNPPRQRIQLSKLPIDDFNQLLAGVLDGYGSSMGKTLVSTWCHESPRQFKYYRAPGGLSQMPHYRPSEAAAYESQPSNIEMTQPSGATLTLKGRVRPNRQTVWAIIRKVQEEVNLGTANNKKKLKAEARAETRSTLQWAAKLLYNMGFDYEDINRDLGSLASIAQIAELSRPEVRRIAGRPDAEVEAEEIDVQKSLP